MELTGPTLVLRPPVPEDLDALYELGRDPEVVRWFSWGPYTSRSEPRSYLDRQAGLQERGEQLDLAVLRDGDLLGITGLSEWVRRDRRATVGSWLAPRTWGTGVNDEAKAIVLALAFRWCALQRVTAYADVHNGRSQRALAKVGFRDEGVLRGFHRHGETQKDVAISSVLLPEWPATPGHGVPVALRGEVPPAFVLA